MNQLIGNKVYDSKELIENLLQDSEGKVARITDLTKSTNRDDALAFQFFLFLDGFWGKDIDLDQDQEFEALLTGAEKFVEGMVDRLGIDYSLNKIFAYKYDESTQEIEVMALIMHIDPARKKMDGLFEKLVRNNL